MEEKAQALADAYRIDVVIVTVWSLDGKSSEAYADDFFDGNGYGYGQGNSGVLLLLAMEYRDWAISTCGDGIYALTDYGIESVFSQIAGSLSEDAYLKPLTPIWMRWSPIFALMRKVILSMGVSTIIRDRGPINRAHRKKSSIMKSR